jgi:hypothetical protein
LLSRIEPFNTGDVFALSAAGKFSAHLADDAVGLALVPRGNQGERGAAIRMRKRRWVRNAGRA